jgi:CubicO group peptidase (beta-lactamase class C family)
MLRCFAPVAAAVALSSASAQESQPASGPLEEESVENEIAPDAAPLENGVRPLTKPDVDAWLDGFMPYAIDDASIVGAVVTVVKDGEILTSRGFGYSDLENRTPVDGYGTMFRPGSISKLFTWIAVMQLVEQGMIDLDEDISIYLDFEIPEAFGAPITMRHLMTHTPGFQERFRNLIIGDEEFFISLEEFLKSSPPPSRIFPPGETPGYSNYGTAVAGYVVQRLSGEPFEEYVEKHIFEPLGMERATFRQPLPDEFEPFMSNGYMNASDGEPQYYELVPMGPAGSLAASGEAMGRFMIGLLDQNPALMKPETWRQMYETIYQLSPPLNAMALGFWELDKGNLPIRGHGGDTIFFHSDLNVIPSKNAGIYVSVNSAGQGAGPLRFALTAGFAERYFPEASVPVGPRLETAKEHGALVAGVYESSRTVVTNFGAILRVLGQQKITINEDGDLVFSLFGKDSRWREVEPFVWRHDKGYERLTAVMTEDGQLDYVTFEPVSPIMHLLPAPWYRSSSLLLPLLGVAVGVLALTLLLWPVRAFARWRYKTAFPLSGRDATAYRISRIGALLAMVFIGAWVAVFQTMSSNLTGLSDAFVTQLRITQFTQVFLYAAIAISIWNLAIVWSGRQSWFAKLWSLMLPISLAIVVWFAAVSSLFSWETNF